MSTSSGTKKNLWLPSSLKPKVSLSKDDKTPFNIIYISIGSWLLEMSILLIMESRSTEATIVTWSSDKIILSCQFFSCLQDENDIISSNGYINFIKIYLF